MGIRVLNETMNICCHIKISPVTPQLHYHLAIILLISQHLCSVSGVFQCNGHLWAMGMLSSSQIITLGYHQETHISFFLRRLLRYRPKKSKGQFLRMEKREALRLGVGRSFILLVSQIYATEIVGVATFHSATKNHLYKMPSYFVLLVIIICQMQQLVHWAW